jgi:hypothetical protein
VKNFLPIGSADMLPLRMALQRRPELWDQHNYRTTFDGTPFGGMSDILLRYSRPERWQGNPDAQALVDDLDLVQYPAWAALPECHATIFDLMRRFQGISLGRVIIAKLPPGGRILAHADDYGAYALQDGLRLHVCVQGLPGCLFHCGDEAVQMASDTVWWFNHRELHSAENHSFDDRVHLLVDIRTG